MLNTKEKYKEQIKIHIKTQTCYLLRLKPKKGLDDDKTERNFKYSRIIKETQIIIFTFLSIKSTFVHFASYFLFYFISKNLYSLVFLCSE